MPPESATSGAEASAAANTTYEQEVAHVVEMLTPDQKIAQMIAIPIESEDFLASISALAIEKEQFNAEHKNATNMAYLGFLVDKETTASASAAPLPPLELFWKNWGFVTLFGENISQTQATQMISYIDEHNMIDELPIWVMVDHEGGSVQRLGGAGFTNLPSMREFCQTNKSQRLEPLVASAGELSQVGVDVILAPVVDIASSHPVLKSRICSGDVGEVFEAAAAFMTVFHEHNILPVLKHFPGIGDTNRDLHTAFDSVSASTASVELYKKLLGVYEYSAVMTSHVGIVDQDETLPCSLSKNCVGQLSQEYPRVLIMSDALEMKSTGVDNQTVYLEDVALQAAYAGNSVLLFGPDVTQSDLKIVHDRLLREYNASYEFRSIVNAHVTQIVQYKLAK